MDNVIDYIFLFSVAGCLATTAFQLYNVFHKGQKYDFTKSILLFLGFIVSWFFGLLVTMLQTDLLIYSVVFRFVNLFFVLNFIFLFALLLFKMGYLGVESIPKYQSMPRKIQNKFSR